jgi:hypothetical protein
VIFKASHLCKFFPAPELSAEFTKVHLQKRDFTECKRSVRKYF